MIYLLSFIVVIGLPVFLHELGHFLAARSVGIRVEKFYIGFNLFGLGLKKKIKETEYGIGLFPLGGYVKVAGILDESMDEEYSGSDDEFRSKNVLQKIWFLSAGVIMNFILSSFIFGIFTFINGVPEIVNEPIIKDVAEIIDEKDGKSPAYTADIQAGDKIISVNNIRVNSWDEMSSIINNNPNKNIDLILERNGNTLNKEILTSSTMQFKNGKMLDVGIIGIMPNYNIIEFGFFKSMISGWKQTYSWIEIMLSSLFSLMTGNISLDQLSGPLGIATIAGDTAQTGGIIALVMLMAIISVNLGIINILPIPGLDGGHVFIALIEGIIRRELPLKVKYGIQTFGFVLLMILFIFVFYNDIRNLF